MPVPALATATEISGVVLLTIGLGVRVITIPLIIVMIVAIATRSLAQRLSGRG